MLPPSGATMSKPPFTRRDFLQTGLSAAAGTALVPMQAAIAAPPSPTTATTAATASPPPSKPTIQTPDVVEFQIRKYLMRSVLPLPRPKDAAEWTTQARRLRQRLLDDVIFYGWPKDWVDSPPKFEDLGLLPSGKGYRLRKLRYEIVPGFQSTALLYEPENLRGKAPATINLNGHDPGGKATPYKQVRCINNALQGMFALSLEWLGMGEMKLPENDHWHGCHLNLAGASATGLFYLAIRRGLDYLCQHAAVDPRRIGATGLSGGAWQTVMIAALDERIAAAVPVAGYFSFTSAIERNSDVGDMEYHPHDLFSAGGDYSTLTAMLAPRPALLIYGAVDEYGLRAPLQKPHLYDDVKPFYKLFGKEENFLWHENLDPGTHNYERDNRLQSYAFFARHFGLPPVDQEVDVRREMRSLDELKVGVPAGNLTIVSLARKLAASVVRPKIAPDRSRALLKELVRYSPVTVTHAWPVYSARNKDVVSMGYWLEFTNGLTATAVNTQRVRDLAPDASVALMLDGRDDLINARVARGERVLAVNLFLSGDASPDAPKGDPARVPAQFRESFSPQVLPTIVQWLEETRPPSVLYSLLLSAAGDRPLGMRAAQLIGIADWVAPREDDRKVTVNIETIGIRAHVAALMACALQPTRFAELHSREGLKTLANLIDQPVRYQEAPELFCLDLLKHFDIHTLAALAEPTRVKSN
jgi:dienelactone hydrolase